MHRSPEDTAQSSLANIYLSVQLSPFPNVFLERLLLDLLAISEVRGTYVALPPQKQMGKIYKTNMGSGWDYSRENMI